MRLSSVHLHDFRNFADARLDLRGTRTFLRGENGQGKTNLLEALGLVTALRSFRTADLKPLVRRNCPEAALRLIVEHEREGEAEVEIRLRRGSRAVRLDGEPLRRLADLVGRFPTVVLASDDIQLLRGSPQLRRRFLDLTLAAASPAYYEPLRRYHLGLQHRNALLKRRASRAELAAFEAKLAPEAVALVEHRARGLDALAATLRTAYAAIGDDSEEPALRYRPSAKLESEADWRALLDERRERDRVLETTTAGPHRDDFALGLFGAPARHFGSEGQQRTLVLALRLAQRKWLQDEHALLPVLLADDVLGELDAGRQERFWAALPEGTQVLATGTQWPRQEATPWQRVEVAAGTLCEQ